MYMLMTQHCWVLQLGHLQAQWWPGLCSVYMKLVLQRSGGRLKNMSVLNLRAIRFSTLYEIIFQCMGKIFCVNFQSELVKFHTKYLSHAWKIQFLVIEILFKEFLDLRACVFEKPPLWQKLMFQVLVLPTLLPNYGYRWYHLCVQFKFNKLWPVAPFTNMV